MAEACPPSFDSHSFISKCPTSRNGWKERALLKNCSAFPQTCKRPLEYHCLLNAYRNRSVEVCAPKTRLVQQYCPSYSLNAQRITDQYNCSTLFPDCPKHQYYSTDVVNYTGCLQELSRANTTATSSQSFESNQDLYFLFFLLFLPLAALIGIYIWWKKRTAAKCKLGSRNRLIKSKEDKFSGCCIEIRRFLTQHRDNQNDEQKGVVDLSAHETENTTETRDDYDGENTECIIPFIQLPNSVAKPFQNDSELVEELPQFEEAVNEEDGRHACNGEIDDVHCKDDKNPVKPNPKNMAENIKDPIHKQNIYEKEDVELSEKEQKNRKEFGKSSCIGEEEITVAENHCGMLTGDSVEDDVLMSDVVHGNQLAVQPPTMVENDEQHIMDHFQKNTGSFSISDTPCSQNDKTKTKDCEEDQRKSNEGKVLSSPDCLEKESRQISETDTDKTVMDLKEEIGNLSNSFSTAFPDHDKLHKKTINTATSTETCEGRESTVNDENQLQNTLKEVLPSVIEEVIAKLGSKFSEGKEFQCILEDQSWTPAQRKEIRNIRERIKKIEKSQNEICELRKQILTLQTEKKSLEETMDGIQKRLHEIQSEKGDEIHKLKTELKKTKNLLRKKEEELIKMKHEMQEKDVENAHLREELRKIKEVETDPDSVNKKRFT
ncbi:reticulocyte-binding protein homolog 2a-like isoform X2 [Saccostrea cucullata]|uniref:reticulocyte-binding protein homolog 2a-like isoform X2 n=1 Tax=Saccostrea cuccullata TaxID=36930 RepID=UPI002ED53746